MRLARSKRVGLVTAAGVIFGILMIFVDKAARALDFSATTIVHLPALYVAMLIGRFLGMSTDQSPDCFPAGIVAQWSVVGLVAGVLLVLWRSHARAAGK